MIGRQVLFLKTIDCIFIHIPKTGGTSIGNTLYSSLSQRLGLGFRPERSHVTAIERRSLYNQQAWEAAFKFTIIRNPWDHVVSWYHWHKRSEPYSLFEDFRSWTLADLPSHRPIDQWLYFTDGDDVIVDYVGRFENLRRVLHDVCDAMRLEPLTTLHHDQRSVPRQVYQEYYDTETRLIVARRFQKIIDYADYRFEQDN